MFCDVSHATISITNRVTTSWAIDTRNGNNAAGIGYYTKGIIDNAAKLILCQTSSWMKTGVTLFLEDNYQRGMRIGGVLQSWVSRPIPGVFIIRSGKNIHISSISNSVICTTVELYQQHNHRYEMGNIAYCALLLPHREQIPLHRTANVSWRITMFLWVFHDVLLVVHDVSHCFKSVSGCLTGVS